MQAKNVLIVDDDPIVCEMFADVLEELGYRVVIEAQASQVLDLVRRSAFDAVLLDLVMPEIDGLALLEQLREERRDLPILVVTGYGGSAVTVEAMRRGATDFVTKPVEGALLNLRIQSACDLELARRLAKTDGLTGLYNHRFLHERLSEEIERAERHRRPLALIMADLDQFKCYNDLYGHPRGDEVLIEVAKTLRQVSRMTDIVARYGGEELTMILPETEMRAAVLVAERARQCIAALRLGGDEAPVTLSLGVASWRPGCCRGELIETADAALYKAKRAGRNCVYAASLGADGVSLIEVSPFDVSPSPGELTASA